MIQFSSSPTSIRIFRNFSWIPTVITVVKINVSANWEDQMTGYISTAGHQNLGSGTAVTVPGTSCLQVGVFFEKEWGFNIYENILIEVVVA